MQHARMPRNVCICVYGAGVTCGFRVRQGFTHGGHKQIGHCRNTHTCCERPRCATFCGSWVGCSTTPPPVNKYHRKRPHGLRAAFPRLASKLTTAWPSECSFSRWKLNTVARGVRLLQTFWGPPYGGQTNSSVGVFSFLRVSGATA